MTEYAAFKDGYTDEYMAYSGGIELCILVRPGTDLDSRFKAWDSDNAEYIMVNGWLFTFESVMENS